MRIITKLESDRKNRRLQNNTIEIRELKDKLEIIENANNKAPGAVYCIMFAC